MLNRINKQWRELQEQLRSKFKWVSYILTIGAFIYLAILLVISGQQINSIPIKNLWRAGILGMVLYLVSLILQFLGWAHILSAYRQITLEDVTIYSRVILLRRLPGGIWHWVGRTSMYIEKSELSGKTIMLANFLEWILLLLAASIIFITGLKMVPIWVKGGFIFGILSISFYLAWSWRTNQAKDILQATSGFLWISIYLVAWGLGGAIVFILLKSTNADTPISWLHAVWVWSVSGGISMLAVFMPAGLGIREITLTLLLRPYISTPEAIIVAIALRFIFTLSDLLWGGLGWSVSTRLLKLQSNTHQQHPS